MMIYIERLIFNIMKISIVTVCYNAESTIDEMIKSVLSQDYKFVEYIIIDGNSKDGTLNLINKYHDRVILVSEPDHGIYDAMNKGLEKATGDFLIFMGADDIFYSDNVLSEIANNIDNNSTVYYGNVLRLKSNKIYDGAFSKLMWGYKNICHQAVFYPKSIYKSKKYDLEYKLVADWVYNLELLADAVNFRYVDVVVSKYNDVNGASSTKVDKKFLSKRRRLIINAVGIYPYIWGIICKAINKII